MWYDMTIRNPPTPPTTKEAKAMKFKVMYRFNLSGNAKGEWHFLSEHSDMFSAKQAVKAIKKHLGYKGGSVKIVTVEA